MVLSTELYPQYVDELQEWTVKSKHPYSWFDGFFCSVLFCSVSDEVLIRILTMRET